MSRLNDASQEHQTFTARATLVAIGIKIQRLGLLQPIFQKVRIAQKTVKFSPAEKLVDALITLLAGAHGLVEANKRVRPDQGLQQAFGRSGCAEQSVIQDTLDACTSENVKQMEEALAVIYRQHSQGYRHPYHQQYQILDIDLTGRPCGPKAAFATPGYFSRQRNRRGRQVGYVLATLYEEVVVQQVFSGNESLLKALQPLVEAAESVLELDEARRRRTILRIDAGGGTVEHVNWLLERGYQLHCKDYSGHRAEKLAASVQEWFTDPEDPNRQFGWVTLPTDGIYVRPVRRIAVRCRKKNGQWGVGVILSTLTPEEVLRLVGESPEKASDPQAVLWAYVRFYDQRGGGVEIEIKEDKHGLGSLRRNKKRFEAQQMVVLLEALAHNLLVWVRGWLADACPRLARWGLLRWIRDVIHINGLVVFHSSGIIQIVLNRGDPVARELGPGLAALLAPEETAIILGEI